MNYSQEEKEYFMQEALKEAKIALENDEIPIGCVVVKMVRLLVVGIMHVRSCSGRLCMRKLWQ